MSATNAAINQAVTTIDQLLALNTGQFTGQGMALVGGLFVLGMAWAGIRVIIEADNATSALAHVAKLTIVAGMAVAIIGGGHNWGMQLSAGFDEIAKGVMSDATGGKQKASSTGEMVTDAFTQIAAAAANILTGVDEKTLEKQPPGSGAERTWNALKNLFTESPLTTVLGFLQTIIFRIALCILILAAAMVYCGQLVVTQVMIKLAMLMMPLMVPWIILEASTFVFNGWLRFTIVAGLTKIVGALIFGITMNAVQVATKMSYEATMQGELVMMMITYFVAFLIVGIVTILMLQTTSIASALLSGHGGGSWSPGGKLSPGGMATAGMNTVKSGGGKLMAGASKLAGGVVGGVNGAFAGAKGFGSGSTIKEAMQSAKAGAKLGLGGTVSAALGGAKAGKGSGGGIRDAAAQMAGRESKAIEKAGNSGQLGSLRQAYRDSRK